MEDRDSRTFRNVISPNSVLAAVIACLLTVAVIRYSGGTSAPGLPYEPRTVTPRGELSSQEQSTIAVFEAASPSVVFIRTKGWQPTLIGRQIERELSSGTGIVWDRSGHVITNLHVVRDAIARGSSASLQVQFNDGSVVDAEFIGAISDTDIAVLSTSPDAPLQPVAIGTSDDLRVGQTVIAIGNPFGFDQTLSTGVIGGLDRTVATERSGEYLDSLIQTDAAINPGNSGGPLLDSAGRLIGVNTAIVSPTGAYSGLGFAVPVNKVAQSVERVLAAAAGEQTPWLGVEVEVLTSRIAAVLGFPRALVGRSLFVKSVKYGSPAAEAGLQPYDVIIKVDDTAMESAQTLQQAIAGRKVGDELAVEILRRERTRYRNGVINVRLEAQKLIF